MWRKCGGLKLSPWPTSHATLIFTYRTPEDAYLSCYPNASLLDIENSEFKYSDNAKYFGDVAQELINEGVRLIGGCCGTTPEHISYIKESVKDLKPVKTKKLFQFIEQLIQMQNVH